MGSEENPDTVIRRLEKENNMGNSFTWYADLKMAGAEEAHVTWTDITSTALLFTPRVPGTFLSGTCDAASASAVVTDIKDSAGTVFPRLHDKGIRGGPKITLDNSGTLVEKNIVSVDADNLTITANGTWGFTAGDTSFWVHPIKAQRYVLLGFEIFSAGQAKYIFQDEAGSPATIYGPMYLSADGGAAIEVARRCTSGSRMYIKQDGGVASAGSLHIWFYSEQV